MDREYQSTYRSMPAFESVVQGISCHHILDRYEHITEYASAIHLRELDELARKGNCQFAHNCKYRKQECSRSAPRDKLVFGIPRVAPKLLKIRDNDW